MFQMKKEAFSVLGKEGSTQQGPGFIQPCGRTPTAISPR